MQVARYWVIAIQTAVSLADSAFVDSSHLSAAVATKIK